MIRYYITDRRQLGGLHELVANVRRVAASGVELIQLREKDLSARQVEDLAGRLLETLEGTPARLLINDRADVAIGCGAAGVHLRSGAVSPQSIRRISPAGFLVAVSCHAMDEVRRAESEGADFVVFGPVFKSPGKGTPVGIEALAEACAAVQIPVLALGGISESRVSACINAGAAGIAGISMFQSADYQLA